MITMLSDYKYDQYRSRFKIGLAIFFLVLTATFGYTSHEFNEEARNYGQLLLIGVAVNVCVSLWLKVKINLKFPFSPVILTFLIWLFIIQFFREDLALSNKNFLNILFTQAFIITISKIFWEVPFRKVVNIFIVYLHLAMITSAYLHVANGASLELGNHNEDVRLGGLFFFGITGVLAGLGAVLSSYQFFKSETFFQKAKYIFSTLVFMTWTLASDMRTVLAGIVVAVFVQLLFKRRAQRKSVLPLIFMALALYGLVKLYKSYSEGTELSKDIETREILWGVGKRLIRENPLFGYGTYTNDLGRVSITDVKYSDLFNTLKLSDPHSSYLSLMIQSGILAFVIFLVFLFKIAQRSKQFDPFDQTLLSIIAFWLICGSTGGNFFDFTYTMQGVAFELTIFAMLLHPDLIVSHKDELSEPEPKREFHRTLEPNVL